MEGCVGRNKLVNGICVYMSDRGLADAVFGSSLQPPMNFIGLQLNRPCMGGSKLLLGVDIPGPYCYHLSRTIMERLQIL